MHSRLWATGSAAGGSSAPVDETRQIARLYWRIAEATGWTPEIIDALSMAEVEELLEHWKEEPPIGACLRAYLGIGKHADEEGDQVSAPREVTPEELERICAAEREFAERASKRNPFTS